MGQGSEIQGRGGERVQAAGLAALYLFSVVALVGYATFGLDPSLLARYPRAAAVYGPAFTFFAQGQIWLAFGVLAAVATRAAGARWIPAFLVLYTISLASELLGTGTGLPFGEYHYTTALGPRWLGHVPLVIPLSWFFMAIPSYALAGPAAPRGAPRILLASLVLLAWDLSLDPAMSRATTYWVWGEPGSYYGMPWLNLVGWYVTGLALMTALSARRLSGWIEALPPRWLAGFYGANLLLPLGMCVVGAMWGAVAATLGVLAATLLAARGSASVAVRGEVAA